MKPRRIGRPVAALACAFISLALAPKAPAQTPPAPSYFEFGTVLAIGQRSIDLHIYDPATHSVVRHTYILTSDTRADLVHVGDQVEVIYTPNGSELTLRRLLSLSAGVPQAGPPPPASTQVATLHPAPTPPAVPKPTPPAVRTARSPQPETPATHAASSAPAIAVKPSVPQPIGLIPVPLGLARVIAPPRTKSVAHAAPSQECQRSSDDWPDRPLSIAVLDFRYPTDREDSHDAGVGGGSGTALADFVFNRLEKVAVPGQLAASTAAGDNPQSADETHPEFLVDRGDRRKLDRSDFAGAARLGRQMGVDAVLAGTFNPIDQPPQPDGSPRPTEYELRAGLVDTCTGQLLMKLVSDSCAANPLATTNGAACVPYTISAKQASNPKLFAQAFQAPVDALLYPLEHNVTAATPATAAGVVTTTNKDSVTLHLTPGTSLRPGDQLAVHASRLTKNPSTYTLNNLQNEEIGRLSVRNVQGATATASFTGDILPKPGDTADPIANP